MYHVVSDDKVRTEWETFSMSNYDWVDEALQLQKYDPTFTGLQIEPGDYYLTPYIIGNSPEPRPNNTGPYFPVWQDYPSVPYPFSPFNWDGTSIKELQWTFEHIESERKVAIGYVGNLLDPTQYDDYETYQQELDGVNDWLQGYVGDEFDYTEPYTDINYPVFDDLDDVTGIFPSTTTVSTSTVAGTDNDGNKNTTTNTTSSSKMVAVLTVGYYFANLIGNILPPGSDGTYVVFENTCYQQFTYQINGPKTIYKGPGDLHDPNYDYLEVSNQLNDLTSTSSSSSSETTYTGYPLTNELCPYTIRMYPSQEYEDRYLTNNPMIYTAVAISIFILTSLVFLLYDILVERRQKTVMKSAVQSNAIVSSLFPSNVRRRLLEEKEAENAAAAAAPQKNRLKTWLNDGPVAGTNTSSSTAAARHSVLMGGGGEGTTTIAGVTVTGKPIADLFPEATVMFADICGFTAWSSIREPRQVFTLLENLYGSFDNVATKRNVFKVETIGDSYVAVAGLPEPRADHAVVMSKFAADCLIRMGDVTRELGISLGPDTEDLCMRVGLHSGPVTAGVLRGQKSRFQLFGDTVNTAARMESTGQPNRIQVSQATADCLIQYRKKSWIVPRQESVEVKGKGMMKTYWVTPKAKCARSIAAMSTASETSVAFSDLGGGLSSTKLERLVDWNVDILSKLIRHIQHRRIPLEKMNTKSNKRTLNVVVGGGVGKSTKNESVTNANISNHKGEGGTVLDEVKEIIELPDYDGYSYNVEEVESIVLELDVMSQLRDFVIAIAMSYEQNPFHNFEHCSHVCMSVAKLMSRIVAADEVYEKGSPIQNGTTIGSTKHDHTYGITSDPLTQFSCVFSALIHDAEHPGVPNTQLVKESSELAVKYNNRSVAEQHSVDLCWDLFMQERFADLRSAICSTENEMKRFRNLVVNSVMATDIMDKDLKNLRNARWERAFSDEGCMEEPENISRSRKATIVIEHLIQASDVAHTMQHWHIYRKWNERLFEEMYRAYKDGRSDKNPAEGWYEGELGFFDFYIIPLAKKLSDCGVFGVSSDEYHGYAMRNREEWERRGQAVVESMVQQLQDSSEHQEPSSSQRLPAVSEPV